MFLSQYKKYFNFHFIKVSFFTGTLTLVRMLTGFISIKVVSVLIGPAGVALLGQLNNFSSIALSIGSAGINNGVTKLVSEHAEDNSQIKSIVNTGLIITLICSFFVSIICVILPKTISEQLFFTKEYYYVILIFGFTLVFYSLNALISSIVNGFKEFKLFVIIGVSTSIIGLLFTILLVKFWSVPGALISAVTYQSVVFFISYFLIRKKDWHRNLRPLQLNRIFAKQYLNYSLMALTTAMLFPISRYWVRSYLINDLGITSAGIWEGMNRFSSMYLSVITSVLSIYYLPKIASLKEKRLIKKEVFSGVITTLPIMLVVSILIYFFRNQIIAILFSKEFSSMQELFLNQLAGDFLKIASWLFAIIMLSKSMTKVYIVSEILFTALYIGLVYYLTPIMGLQGVVMANTINYIVYFVFAIILFRNFVLKPK